MHTKSTSKTSYGLIVPAGAELSSFSGEVAAAIAALQPMVKKKSNIELEGMCKGDLLVYHQRQLAEHGASLQKIEVQFIEVSQQ